MKISHLLEAPSPLQAFISKNIDQFQQVGNAYLFIWTNELLKALIKAGANANRDLKTVTVPNEIGLGIVNPMSGDICVGAIDDGYDALWAASDDVSDFFAATRNRKLIRLPNRLQNLADLLKQAAEPEAATGGVDGIVEYIEEEGWSDIDVDAIKSMDSVDEVKDYLEDQLASAKQHLDGVKPKIDELMDHYDQLNGASNKAARQKILSQVESLEDGKHSIVTQAEDILDQHHLFKVTDTTGIDQSDDSDSDTEAAIDKWTRSFNRDFPDLDLRDAREFGLQ